MNLAGKTALVTGAAGGLGSAIAGHMQALGATVVRTDRIADAGGDLPIHALDVCEPDAWTAALAQVVEQHGSLDILVHAAGFYQPNIPFADLTLETWRAHSRINLESAFLGCQAGMRTMAAGSGGSILLFSSTLAAQPTPQSVAYACAKAGIETLVRAAAQAGGPAGVRVNAIAPGPIDTPMLRGNVASGGDVAALFARLAARVPLGRLGTPADAAALAAFLCSDGGAFVSGAVIPLDGGQIA